MVRLLEHTAALENVVITGFTTDWLQTEAEPALIDKCVADRRRYRSEWEDIGHLLLCEAGDRQLDDYSSER